MDTKDILAAIDDEIAMLIRARGLLSGKIVRPAAVKLSAAKAHKAAPPVKEKRKLTPEGRARIAEAVKKRWAAQKKAAKT